MSTGAVRAKVNYLSEPNSIIPLSIDKVEEKSFVEKSKELTKASSPTKTSFFTNQNFNVSASRVVYSKEIKKSIVLQKFKNVFLRIDNLSPIPLTATYPVPENFESLSNVDRNLNLVTNLTRDVYEMFGDKDFNISLEIPHLPKMTLLRKSGIGSKSVVGCFRQVEIDPSDLPKAVLEIPNSKWFPLLSFKWEISENGSTLESENCGAFPKIKLEFEEKEFFKLKTLRNWTFSVANDSVQAFIFYTRLVYLITKEHCLNLNFAGALNLKITFSGFPREEIEKNKIQSSLYRKLKFLQIVFGLKVKPQQISEKDISLIECIFRGIIEGKFSLRGGSIVFPGIKLSRKEVTLPPFTAPTSVGMYIPDTKTALLGNYISVGAVKCFLEQAEVIDSDAKEETQGNSLVDEVFKDPGKNYDIEFLVLDNQIHYEFEDYLDLTKQIQVRIMFSLFEQRLKKEEPEELANLLTESLVKDVNKKEAQNIAMGWLLGYRFSSLFTVGNPKLKEQNVLLWRVPILWEPIEKVSREVGEIFIDSKNGKIVDHSKIQEITDKTIEASLNLPKTEVIKYSYYGEHRHRAILVVKNVINDHQDSYIEAIIPSWGPDKVVKFSKNCIEDTELAIAIKPEMFLTAELKMLAEEPKDLFLKNFLLLSNTKPKRYLSSLL